MKKFKKILMSIQKRFDRKTATVFISNSENCACNYYLKLSRKTNKGKVLHITDINKTASDIIRTNGSVFIFTHGDANKLKCYYNHEDRRIDISDEWWKNIQRGNGIIYFHVCYGSKIIQKSPVLLNRFNNWVSYSERVIYYRCDDFPKLDKVYEDMLNLTYDASTRSKNAADFKNAIVVINENFKDRISEIPEIGNMLVTSLGTNMAALTCSE